MTGTSAADKIKERWTDKNWLWSAHQAAELCGLKIRSARRAFARLEKEGWIAVYKRNCSAGKTLWRKL